MRSLQAKKDIWPLGGADPPAEEPFDSFGPVSDIWRALHPERSGGRPGYQAPHERTRILLADADPVHRRMLRIILSSANISLIEVEDGQAAVDLLALRRFDLVLLDLGLSRMSGEDTVRWVRRSQTPWADIPIIGMADAKHRDGAGRLMSAGMTSWIPKPVSRSDLARSLLGVMPGLQGIEP